MSTKIEVMLALSLILRAAAQDVAKVQTHCGFADGKTINVTSLDHKGSAQLTTNESLVTVKGIIPGGNYVISPLKDSHDNWTLAIKKAGISKNAPSQLPPVPLSVSTSASRVEKSAISFDQTGGSCKMLWQLEDPNVVLSLEFAERNTDIPVLP